MHDLYAWWNQNLRIDTRNLLSLLRLWIFCAFLLRLRAFCAFITSCKEKSVISEENHSVKAKLLSDTVIAGSWKKVILVPNEHIWPRKCVHWPIFYRNLVETCEVAGSVRCNLTVEWRVFPPLKFVSELFHLTVFIWVLCRSTSVIRQGC